MKKRGRWVGRERPSLHRMPDRVIAKARTQFAGGIPAPRGTPGEPNPHDLGRAHRPPGSCVLTFSTYEVALTVGGLAALLAAWIPAYTSRRPLSLPIILVAVGAAFFLLPVGLARAGSDRAPGRDRARQRARRHCRAHGRRPEDRPALQLAHVGIDVAHARHRHAGHHRAHRDARCGRRWSCRNQRAAPRRRAGADRPGLGFGRAGGGAALGESANPEAEDDVRFTLTSEGGLNDRWPSRSSTPRSQSPTRMDAVVMGGDLDRVGSGGADPHRSGRWLGRRSAARDRGLPTARTVERTGRDSAGLRGDRGDAARVRRDRAAPGIRLPGRVRRGGRAPGHRTHPRVPRRPPRVRRADREPPRGRAAVPLRRRPRVGHLRRVDVAGRDRRACSSCSWSVRSQA